MRIRARKWVINLWTITLAMLQAIGLNPILPFERSPYGLLFTEIEVQGRLVSTMIDFGDPQVLTLSSRFIERHDLAVHADGRTAYDIHGTAMPLMVGKLESARVGPIELAPVTFGNLPGEIERVAEQVGTEFDAVIGWGFFREHSFVLDFAASRLEFQDDDCAGFDAQSRLDLAAGASHLMAETRIAGQPVRVLIDTGASVNTIDRTLLAEVDAAHRRTVRVRHVAGDFDGVELDMALATEPGAPGRPVTFEAADLSVLEPLGARAILGPDFLREVQLCHAPAAGQLLIRTQPAAPDGA